MSHGSNQMKVAESDFYYPPFLYSNFEIKFKVVLKFLTLFIYLLITLNCLNFLCLKKRGVVKVTWAKKVLFGWCQPVFFWYDNDKNLKVILSYG